MYLPIKLDLTSWLEAQESFYSRATIDKLLKLLGNYDGLYDYMTKHPKCLDNLYEWIEKNSSEDEKANIYQIPDKVKELVSLNVFKKVDDCTFTRVLNSQYMPILFDGKNSVIVEQINICPDSSISKTIVYYDIRSNDYVDKEIHLYTNINKGNK